MGSRVREKCVYLRSELERNLKNKFPAYMSQVVDWLRKRKTRAELDLEVFDLHQEPLRELHLKFLTNLSKLCWGLRSLRIEIPQQNLTCLMPGGTLNEERSPRRRMYKDPTLPGLELIRARLLVAAWDAQLSNVDRRVSRLLYCAMRHHVKNIIQAAIADKSPAADRPSIDGLSFWCALTRTNYDLPANFILQDRSCRQQLRE